MDTLPAAKYMLADRGYDADWFRSDLQVRGITPCILYSAEEKQKTSN